jgi:hypothetical protein
MREKCSRRMINDKKAASPAISMVIVTAATVMLVLVAGSFATIVLDRQQAETEFNALQKSILALDDAIRDVAWKQGASRSVRFTTDKGSFQGISPTRSVEIRFNGEYSLGSFDTSVIKYAMSDSYIALDSEYIPILGDENLTVSSVSESLAQVSLTHESGFAIISLGYRLRISNEGSVNVDVEGTKTTVNYVNIYLIELSPTDFPVSSGPFDLVAKNTEISTFSSEVFSTNAANFILIELDGTQQESVPLNLDQGKVLFNLIISKVSVSA